jgi:DNA-binding MarR family transcriptional regulator
MDSPEEFCGNDETACIHRLMMASKSVVMRLNAELERAGLSSARLWALMPLAHSKGPVSIGYLATMMGCGKSNATQIVDRLEADGLVQRVADPEDRRSVLVQLTDMGRQRQQATIAARERVSDALMAQFSDDERDLLMDYLQRIIEAP